MDLHALREASDSVCAEVRGGGFGRPAPGAWSVETVVAHLTLSNRMLAIAAASLEAGVEPMLDNAFTQSPPLLGAVISAEGRGGLDGLLDTFTKSTSELLEVLGALDASALDRAVPVRFVDGGVVRVDAPLPFGALLETFHLDGHRAQISVLRHAAPASR